MPSRIRCLSTVRRSKTMPEVLRRTGFYMNPPSIGSMNSLGAFSSSLSNNSLRLRRSRSMAQIYCIFSIRSLIESTLLADFSILSGSKYSVSLTSDSRNCWLREQVKIISQAWNIRCCGSKRCTRRFSPWRNSRSAIAKNTALTHYVVCSTISSYKNTSCE